MKEEILDLFFNKKFKQKEIAEKLGISKSKVSRIVTKEERYLIEKQERKDKSQIRHSDNTKEYVRTQRKQLQFKHKVDDLILRKIHEQDVMELSKSKKLSDMAYREWNTSAYKYNENKKRYEFREELGRSYDVKKYLKGTIN